MAVGLESSLIVSDEKFDYIQFWLLVSGLDLLLDIKTFSQVLEGNVLMGPSENVEVDDKEQLVLFIVRLLT
jgi:hypothetical protein